ncbi:MAG: hypothetical protein KAX19_07135, partial [Candidatus Brocadiae bacterium]|nr:hypothetical protein [Candidatus Brocadiia bacterium]
LDSFQETWGVGGTAQDPGLHPTLVSKAEEWPVLADEGDIRKNIRKMMCEDSNKDIHRNLWFRVGWEEKQVKFGCPDGVRGIPVQVVELRCTSAEEDLAARPEGQPPLKLSCTVRLLSSGAGTCTFRLVIGKVASPVDADFLLSNIVRLPQWGEPLAGGEEEGTGKHGLDLLDAGEEDPKARAAEDLPRYVSMWKLAQRVNGAFLQYLREKVVASCKTAKAINRWLKPLWISDAKHPTVERVTKIYKLLSGALPQNPTAGGKDGTEADAEPEPAEDPGKKDVNPSMSPREQRDWVDELLQQYGSKERREEREKAARLRQMFPIALRECDTPVLSDRGNAIDPQIPYFVGVGILKGGPPPGTSRFDFMKTTQDRPHKRHTHAIEMLLRIMCREAFQDANSSRLLPDEPQSMEAYPLRNRLWNDYLWLAFGTRAALMLGYEEDVKVWEGDKGDRSPTDRLRQAFRTVLIDTCELLRGRWHTLVILNWTLDKVILQMRGAGPIGSEILDSIIGLRRQFALYLNNPMVYRFEGGSFTTVMQEARTTFWIELLERTLTMKFQHVDRMFEEQLHRQALEQLERGVT